MAVKHIGLLAGLFLLGGISAMLLADSQTPKEAVIPSPAAPLTAAPKVEVPTHYTFVRQIGKSAPRGRDISRIAVDAHGLLYGLDGGAVVVWQSDGRILRRFGQWDRDNVSKERLQNPQALTLDNQDNVFVADGYDEGGEFGNRVVEYTTAGRFVRTFDAGETPHPQKYAPEEMRLGISFPLSITTDGHAGLFLADDAGYLWHFTTRGRLLGSFLIPPPVKPGLNPAFQMPKGLAADGQGHLFVGSAFTVASGFSSGILEFTDTGRFLRRFDASGPDAVGGVTSLVWASGKLFAADQTHNRVAVFSGQGVLVRSFPVADTPPGGFYPELGLAAGTDALWAADSGHRRLRKFTLAGKIAGGFPTDASSADAVESPSGVAWTAQHHLLVTDAGKNQVLEFTQEGKLVRTFGGFGGGPGEFRTIGRVATDRSGRVFVTDGIPGRVEVFAPNGKFLYQLGMEGTGQLAFATSIAVSQENLVYVGDFSRKQITVFRADSQFLPAAGGYAGFIGGFETIGKLTLSHEGHIFATDIRGTGSMKEFTPEGKLLSTWADSHLHSPDSLAFNTQGHLLVTEDGPGTPGAVLEYTAAGAFLGQFGTAGPGKLSVPSDIAVDNTGTVAVVDFGHDRVALFQPSEKQ